MSSNLKKTLTPTMLWGLGVGYVISGMFFGWNLGLKEGGTLGMAIATLLIIIMYLSFSFSYAELACAIPKAGGAFDYAHKILGRDWGFIVGIVQVIEFVFAPPAIALGIGAYFHLLFPDISITTYAIIAYILFTALNTYGVKAAAAFEFTVTIIALAGLILFAVIAFPHFEQRHLEHNALPNGWTGVFSSLPFAIWFFLGIEGMANVAEETIHPQRDITRGFASAMFTLIIVCIITFIFSIGIGGWELIVLDANGNTIDSPLPLALKVIVSEQGILYKIIVAVGVLGLVASFNGLLLAAGRATFELGRKNYIPSYLGKTHRSFETPHIALIFNMIIGIIALLAGKTSEIIIMSVFGALILYVFSMISLIVFRIKDPHAPRPFKVPLYPLMPIVALIMSFVSLLAVIYFNFQLAMVFLVMIIVAYLVFKIFVKMPEEIEGGPVNN